MSLIQHAFISITDEVEHRNFFALRRLQSSAEDMAYLFSKALERQPVRRLNGASFFLRLGCVNKGTLPEAIHNPHDIPRDCISYEIRFLHGTQPLLIVSTKKHGISFQGPLVAFCHSYATVNHAALERAEAKRIGARERQRARRQRAKSDAASTSAFLEKLRKKGKLVKVTDADTPESLNAKARAAKASRKT